MPGLFDDILDGATPAAAPSAAPAKPAGLFDDILTAPAPVGVAEDVAKSAGAGYLEGAAGLVGLPGTVVRLLDKGADELAKLPERAINAVRGNGFTAHEIAPEDRSPARAASPAGLLPDGGTIVKAIEGVAGRELHKPQGQAAKYVHTIAENVPGAGRKLIAQALVPGIASEFVGQKFEGTALEPWARFITSIGSSIGAGKVGDAIGGNRLEGHEALFGELRKATPDQLSAADAMVLDARASGVAITPLEALAKVTGNKSYTDLQRVVESSPRGAELMGQFIADRTAAIEGASLAQLDTIAPSVGDDIRPAEARIADTAQAAVDATPEAQALAAARQQAGPRVTPDQAGAVIQAELRAAYDQRVEARAAQSGPLYEAAREAPATVPLPDRRPVGTVVGDDFPGGPAPARREAPAAPEGAPPVAGAKAETEAAGETLAQFIARNGGLELNGDARAAGLDRWRIPYGGAVARPGGRSVDDWREILADEGYIARDPDGFIQRDIRDELAELLRREQSGEKILRQDVTGPTRASEAKRADLDRVELERVDQIRGDVSRELEELTGSARGLDEAAISKIAERINAGENVDVLEAYERAVMESPAPAPRAPAGPVPGLEEPRLGQVDASPVVDFINRELAEGGAKGAQAAALRRVRRALHSDDGNLDATVSGLQGSRKAIAAELGKATDGDTKRLLMDVRDELDRALESVPEFAEANRVHADASRPLDRFEKGKPLGRVVERDEFNRDFTLPRERAPGAIEEGGASAAREFSDVAPNGSAARTAYEGHLTTRLLDDATDATTGNVDAGKIRTALRDRADELEQFPAVRARLERVAFSREGLEAVEASPLGRMAHQREAGAAIEALFPKSAKNEPGRGRQVTETVSALAARNPRAAEDLVRIHLETELNAALKSSTGPGDAPTDFNVRERAGAEWVKRVYDNPAQREQLEAAFRGLPNGAQRLAGLRRFFDVLEATGMRQGRGSPTHQNRMIGEKLEGGVGKAAVQAVATAGLSLKGQITKAIDQWRYGRGTEQIARVLTGQRGAPLLQQLAREGRETPRAQALALRVLRLGNVAASTSDREPLVVNVDKAR